MINKFLNTLFPEPCPVCSGKATDHLTAPIVISPMSTPGVDTGGMCYRQHAGTLISDLSAVLR